MEHSSALSKNTCRLLLVDDCENDVMMIKDALQRNGCFGRIDVVSDGEAALRYLRKEPPYEWAQTPGLVLLDIRLPSKNGFEVLADMKKDPLLQRIPVLMLTASDRKEEIERAYSAGACSYLVKPGNSGPFIEMMRDFAVYWALVSKIPQH